MAGLLGQPVGAVAIPPGAVLGDPVVQYSSAPLPTGGQKTTLSADSAWAARTPYNVPNAHIAGPGWAAGPAPTPPSIGTSCHVNYKPGISLGNVVGLYRIGSWIIPSAAFGAFDATKAASGYYLIDPHAAYDTITPDGTVNLVNDTPALPGSALLSQVITNMPQHGSVVTYVMTGKIAAALTSNICVIDTVVEQGRSSGQPWCNVGVIGTGCVPPSVTLVAPPSPPCQGAACIPPVSNFISLFDLMNQAKQLFTDGGTISAAPIPGMEAVQIPATFTLTGGSVGQGDQYMTIEVPISNAGTSVGVASYQIRISYTDTTWSFDDISPPAEHSTNQTFTTTGSPAVVINQAQIGHWMVRAVDNFDVEFRSVYIYDYPAPPASTPWAAFPGGASSFQLCALPAAEPPPTCGPGIKAIWGQFEAVVVNPGPH